MWSQLLSCKHLTIFHAKFVILCTLICNFKIMPSISWILYPPYFLNASSSYHDWFHNPLPWLYHLGKFMAHWTSNPPSHHGVNFNGLISRSLIAWFNLRSWNLYPPSLTLSTLMVHFLDHSCQLSKIWNINMNFLSLASSFRLFNR